jgi:hypothetical protein
MRSDPIFAAKKSKAIAISGEKITGKRTGRRNVSRIE